MIHHTVINQKNDWCHWPGSYRNMRIQSAYALQLKFKHEIVRKDVRKSMKKVKHLHSRQIVLDGWRLQGATEKLCIRVYGDQISRQRIATKINAERKISSDLCAEIGICAFRKGIGSRKIHVVQQCAKTLCPYK